jgi:hypothetical protein
LKLIFLLILFTALAAQGYSQASQSSVPGVAVKDVYLAKDDGSGKAGEAVTSFITTDIPIYCVVLLDSGTTANVKMNFVAVNVPGVKPETKVVSTSYTTKDGQDRVNFTGRPAKLWTSGKYRLDIFLDDKFVKNLAFEIQKPQSAVGSAEMMTPKQTTKPKTPSRLRVN